MTSSPIEAFTQGLNSGAMINDVQVKQQQQQAATAQQQMRTDWRK